MTPSIVAWFARMRAFATARPLAFLAVLMGASLAAAAITITYSNSSVVTTGVTAPPVQFLSGDDAGPAILSDYVTAYAISTNKTYVTSTVKGVPEAALTVDSFFRLTNVDDASHGVTLSTSQVSNVYVTAYTIEIFTIADVSQGTLTLTDATPSVTFTLPAGTTYYATLDLVLATGAGADNVALTSNLAMAVT